MTGYEDTQAAELAKMYNHQPATVTVELEKYQLDALRYVLKAYVLENILYDDTIKEIIAKLEKLN